MAKSRGVTEAESPTGSGAAGGVRAQRLAPCLRRHPDQVGAGTGEMSTSTFGPAYEPRLDRVRLRTQLSVIRDVMLSAAECGTWCTLRELGQITGYGEASISAQLRHLRKPQFGGYVVEKRRRRGEGLRAGSGPAGAVGVGVWEYRVQTGGGWSRQRESPEASGGSPCGSG